MNFVVVDPAQQPLEQSAPKLRNVIFLALFAAFALSTAFLSAVIHAKT
jgi:uncharacterized protein involved in exopolysaccharide biosynthesis